MPATSISADRDYSAALREARALLRHHGKSYYFSTCLFPRGLQQSTSALYAFVRLPDEIVDNSPQETPEDLQRVRERLLEFLENWRVAYGTGNSGDAILDLTAYTFHKHNVPYEYSEAFLRAMIQDTEQTRYQDYADLEKYMYGSASCVGLMMSHIIGFNDPKALEHATRLGNAMQLTNFLRDIDEDYQLRNRVYLPQDELARWCLGDEDIAARRFSPKFREFMGWQVTRAHNLYEEANAGIAMLNPEGRMAVATASTLYRAILNKLAAQNFNPFAKRAATNFGEKIVLTGRAWKLSRTA
jgi:phytoene synthase